MVLFVVPVSSKQPSRWWKTCQMFVMTCRKQPSSLTQQTPYVTVVNLGAYHHLCSGRKLILNTSTIWLLWQQRLRRNSSRENKTGWKRWRTEGKRQRGWDYRISGRGLTVSEQGVHVITERKEKIMLNKKGEVREGGRRRCIRRRTEKETKKGGGRRGEKKREGGRKPN